MRINCARIDAALERYQRRHEQWHRWFAWRPVTVGEGECRWFESVERRKYENPNYHIGGYLWEYRPLDDITGGN